MNASSWIDAASEAEVPDDDVIGLQVGEHNIALYKVDGSVFATDNICTHGHARLCDGFLDGHEIECPCTRGSSMSAMAAPPAHRLPRH